MLKAGPGYFSESEFDDYQWLHYSEVCDSIPCCCTYMVFGCAKPPLTKGAMSSSLYLKTPLYIVSKLGEAVSLFMLP